MFTAHENLPRCQRRWWLLALLLLSGSVAAAPLALSVVEQRNMPHVFVTDALVEAVHQATLTAETTGRIKQILFDVDDLVTQGEVLLRFTDKEQQAGLQRAEAGVKEASARLVQAQAEHARIESVFAKKLVARSALDKSSADLKAAQQRLQAAKADLTKAREQLEYTVVRAPYAGIVVERHVNVGERVRPGSPLMTGFSLAKLRATSSVPQSIVAAVREHGEVSIAVDPAEPVVSKKITVYPYADAASHNFSVRAELSSVPAGWYPGMYAKARFVIGKSPRLLVPSKAVVHRSEVTAVYVVDKQGQVGFRAVRVGQQFAGPGEEENTEILAGLQAGEQVALDPVKAGVLLKTQRAEK
jgi:RND family efflux transporter MFP subunit